MTIPDQKELLHQLKWRYAVKAFDPSRRLDAATWEALEQSMILAPSSFGLQPWRFVVVTDERVKAELPPVSWGQTQPRDCSHMVVLAARRFVDEAYVDAYIDSIVAARGGEASSLAGLKKMILGFVDKLRDQLIVWSQHQVYIALGQLMTAAAMIGIDTCPMEGIDLKAYDKILGLDGTPYTTTVGCAVGYRLDSDKYATMKKVRFTPEMLVQRI